MAERQSRPRTRRAKPYDPNNCNNWTANQLREQLQKMGIWTPGNMSKTILKQLFTENSNRNDRQQQNNRDVIPSDTASQSGTEISTAGRAVIAANTSSLQSQHVNRHETSVGRRSNLDNTPIGETASALIAEANEDMVAPQHNFPIVDSRPIPAEGAADSFADSPPSIQLYYHQAVPVGLQSEKLAVGPGGSGGSITALPGQIGGGQHVPPSTISKQDVSRHPQKKTCDLPSSLGHGGSSGGGQRGVPRPVRRHGGAPDLDIGSERSKRGDATTSSSNQQPFSPRQADELVIWVGSWTWVS